MVGSRSEQIALLEKLMIDRGLKPEIDESNAWYKFGVKEADASK